MNNLTKQKLSIVSRNRISMISFLLLFSLLSNTKTHATIVVTAGTGGANISADKAANSTTPTFTTLLGKIYIIEGAGSDFAANQTGVTFTLAAPANWSFNPNVGTVAKTGHGSFTGNATIAVTASAITVTFSTSADVTGIDSLIISSIAVESSTGLLLPNAGNITRNGGSALMNGFTSSNNCGSLSQVAGALHHFVLNPDINNNSNVPSPQRTGIAFSTTINAKDQFNNTAVSFVTAATLTVNGGTISPATSGNFVAGIKTVSITLTTVGNGRIITATSSTKTGTSNAISVNSDGLTPQGSLSGSTLCNGANGTLKWTATLGTNPYSVTYSNGIVTSTATGVVSGTSFNVASNPTTTTTYTLISVTDANGNIRNNGFTAGSTTVNVLPRPTSVISGTATICKGSSTNLSVLFTGTAPFTFRVNGGSAIVATNNPQTVNVSPTATTVYTITNLSDGNCTALSGDMTGTVTVSVNVTSSVMNTTLNASVGEVCNNGNQSSTLTQSGGVLGTSAYWQWYGNASFTNAIGGHLTTGNASLIVNPTSTTTYYLRAEGTASPCTGIVAVANSVTIIVDQPTVGGTITNASCNGAGTLTLTGNVGAVQKWQWSSVPNFSTDVHDVINYTTTLTYTISTTTYYRVLVKNGVCDSAYSNTITLSTTGLSLTINPPVGATPGDTASPCHGLTNGYINFHPAGGTGSYAAILTDGNSTTTVYSPFPNPIFPNLGAGNYTVTLVDTNTHCSINQTIRLANLDSITFLFSVLNATCTTSNDGQLTIVNSNDTVATHYAGATGGSGYYFYSIDGIPHFNYYVPPIINNLNSGTYLVQVADNYGCLSQVRTVVVGVTDLPPILSPTPSNITVSCDSVPVAPSVVATDHCDSVVAVNYSEVRSTGACANNYLLTRTWRATDSHSNTVQWIQIITIHDVSAPTWITDFGALDRSVECNDAAGLAAAQALIPTANDNCTLTLIPVKTAGSFITAAGSCPQAGTYTNTWIVNDGCGNSAATLFTQTITIFDHTAPTWTTQSNALNRSVECGDSAGLAAAKALIPTATDNCAQSLNVVKIGSCFSSSSGGCAQAGSYTNIWTVSDGCGNYSSANFTQTITVSDTTPPAWTSITGLLNRSVECSDTAALAAAQAMIPVAHDNCATILIPLKTTGSFVSAGGSCPQAGTYTNTWTVSDGCNNAVALAFSQTITIYDHTAPTWVTASGALNRTVGCSDSSGLIAAQALTPIAHDNCTLSLSPIKTSGSFVSAGGNCPQAGTYTNTWTVADGCGNTITSAFTQTITINDQTPPTWFTANGALDHSVSCTDSSGLAAAQALAPTTRDNCTLSLNPIKTSGSFVSSGGSCHQSGTYTNTWSVADGCGNNALTVYTQTITIFDHTAPTWITTTSSLDRTMECSDVTALAAAQTLIPVAADNCASTLNLIKTSGSFVSNSSGSCSQAGTYTNTWTVTDGCGNSISSVFSQTITIYDHTTPVWVSTPGALDRTVECSDANALAAAQALRPTASDNCALSMSPVKTSGNFVSSGNPCPQTGTYTNTFTISDGCGNAASTSYSQIITITDHTAPTWSSSIGSLNRSVACSDSISLVAAQSLIPIAIDNCTQSLIPIKTSGSFVPGINSQSGTYTNTFTITDGCGNTATSAFTQVITIDANGPSSTLCPVYYDRCVRMAATTSNLFLQAIFAWDNLSQNASSCPSCETNNLLKYLQNNHINKIIIDGIAYHSPNGCGAGPLGLIANNTYSLQLSNFITNAKTNYGVTTVLAGIHEAPEVLNGDINGSKSDIAAIVAYNNNSAYTGKIDQFWLDYEFWNANANMYCINCPISNPCNVPFFPNSSNYIDVRGRTYTEFGFTQFKKLIAYTDSMRLTTTSMQKSEVLITPNISFNISEAYPPYHIGYNLQNQRYVFDTTGGTLTQALAFADWLMNPSHNIGAIAVDLTGLDGRNANVNTITCSTGNVHDAHSCNALTPDHFLNVDVDNSPNDLPPCTDPWDPNHFGTNNAGGFRQRCFDFLGSFGNGSIPICPYFSTESLTFNTVNALSNYMTGDVCPNNNPAYNGVCANSKPHYIPQIDSTFMAQYQNSWKESFVQSYTTAPTQLYSDPVYTTLSFNHQQSPAQSWWGALNSLTLGSMEFFPMNSYPLVLDNVPCHGYNITNHVNAFAATTYPNSTQPPFMYIPQDRSQDGAPDKYITCSHSSHQQNAKSASPINTPTPTILDAAMYPNPSEGNFELTYQLPTGRGTFTITDITGSILFKLPLLGMTNTINIDLSSLSQGIYFWKITTSTNETMVGKVVIIK